MTVAVIITVGRSGCRLAVMIEPGRIIQAVDFVVAVAVAGFAAGR